MDIFSVLLTIGALVIGFMYIINSIVECTEIPAVIGIGIVTILIAFLLSLPAINRQYILDKVKPTVKSIKVVNAEHEIYAIRICKDPGKFYTDKCYTIYSTDLLKLGGTVYDYEVN